MLETPHVALGIAIAVAIPNPVISLPLALASHYILDLVPHWNPHIRTEMKKYGKLQKNTLFIIGLDLALTLVLTVYLSGNNITLYMAAFAAILPDIAEGPYFLLGWRNKSLDSILRFQKALQVSANMFWGLITQIIVILSSLYWISL